MKKLLLSLTLAGFCIILIQCKSKKLVISPVPTDVVSIAQKRWSTITQADLDSGKTIFETKCTKCHAKKVITKRNEDTWQKAINKMAPRARLTAIQKENLTHYIFAMREAGKN